MINVMIIILNWNRWEDTLGCLASLHEQNVLTTTLIPSGVYEGQELQTQAIVVDNGSTDESIEKIRTAYPTIEILALTRNFGFGGGMNAGIKCALDQDIDYVCLLNNDTFVGREFILRMLIHANKPLEDTTNKINNNVGLMAPAVYYADSPNEIWSTGGGFNWWLMEMTGNHGQGEPLPDTPFERQVLTGCALLVRADVFQQIGLLDERFFMYYEDLDFCVSSVRAGYRLLVVPEAKIWHRVSQSSGGVHSPAERFHVAVSSGRYFRKQMRLWQAPLIVPYRIVSALRWTFRLGRSSQWDSIRAYWRGLMFGWFGDPYHPVKF